MPTVSVEHVHAPKVSVREQMSILRARLHRLPGGGSTTFRTLVADCATRRWRWSAVSSRLLELYREGVVAFDQAAALTELRVRWTGVDDTGDGGGAGTDDR